jgi:hypothetical protein
LQATSISVLALWFNLLLHVCLKILFLILECWRVLIFRKGPTSMLSDDDSDLDDPSQWGQRLKLAWNSERNIIHVVD